MNEGKEIEGWSVGTFERGSSLVSPSYAEHRNGTRTTSIEVYADGYIKVERDERYDGLGYACSEIPLEVLRAVLGAAGFDLVKRES